MKTNHVIIFSHSRCRVDDRVADCGYLVCLFSSFVSAGKAASSELDVIHATEQEIQSGSDNTHALLTALDGNIIAFLCSSA